MVIETDSRTEPVFGVNTILYSSVVLSQFVTVATSEVMLRSNTVTRPASSVTVTFFASQFPPESCAYSKRKLTELPILSVMHK
ncbi:MAG: hypothetical protein SGI88_14600 [Candidatus Hydrogenedentes bacterium]|nr:hypothetical protein [Candidatus Hydrogenedentota bacterium]